MNKCMHAHHIQSVCFQLDIIPVGQEWAKGTHVSVWGRRGDEGDGGGGRGTVDGGTG